MCPGKTQTNAITGAWARDLNLDVEAIRAWGASIVVTLVEDRELVRYRVKDLGAAVTAAGMAWRHLPIRDVSTPDAAWEMAWAAQRDIIHGELERGGKVLVHCLGGLGRAGTVASRILIEQGVTPGDAMAAVRAVRPGAIETAGQ